MIRLLDAESEIHDAWAAFRKEFIDSADWVEEVAIGYQGGQDIAPVAWHSRPMVWGSFNEHPIGQPKASRFWNAFGVEDPRVRTNLTITCEVNPSRQGIDRRVGGLFAKEDASGKTLLLHTGKIGGGRPGIGKELFWTHWSGIIVRDSDRPEKFAVVATLETGDVPDQIANFVRFISQIKARKAGNK